jgi:dihydrodipicolinate synthase/N-acetylneuraminate lyase
LCDLVHGGELDAARQLQRQLVPMARFISTGHGLPALKAALALSGIDVGRPRRPLRPLDERHLPALRELLRTFTMEGTPV